MSLRLSVLDQSPVRAGGSAADAVRETIALARACERLGYHRYWLAEHHNAPGLAGSTPEVLVTRVAAATETMRVGAGGVMLPHYSALKVAENFRMLETLFPGRIDLGVGRAPGADRRTAIALNVKSAAGDGAMMAMEHFPQQVADLRGYLTGRLDPEHPFRDIKAMPAGAGAPEMWLLGSSDQSAQLAAHFGLAFSFAHFISEYRGLDAVHRYFSDFRPSDAVPEPRANVGVFVLCADTEEAARELALSRDLWRLRLDRGEIGPVPSVEEAAAAALGWTQAEQARVERNRRRQVVGTPDQVRAQLEALAADFGVDELVIVSICYDFAARLRSYELLAAAFDLRPRAAA